MSWEDQDIEDDGEAWPETRADAASLLDMFESEAWPIYERRGFTFQQAILTHLLAQSCRRLDQMLDK